MSNAVKSCLFLSIRFYSSLFLSGKTFFCKWESPSICVHVSVRFGASLMLKIISPKLWPIVLELMVSPLVYQGEIKFVIYGFKRVNLSRIKMPELSWGATIDKVKNVLLYNMMWIIGTCLACLRSDLRIWHRSSAFLSLKLSTLIFSTHCINSFEVSPFLAELSRLDISWITVG